MRVLFRFLVQSYTVRIPQLLENLRDNYDMISHLIKETTLGLDSPLH